MLQGLSGWHFIILLFIILLLFGAPKLPGLAKSIGQSMRILKKEVRADAEETAAEKAKAEQAEKAESAKSEAPKADGEKSE